MYSNPLPLLAIPAARIIRYLFIFVFNHRSYRQNVFISRIVPTNLFIREIQFNVQDNPRNGNEIYFAYFPFRAEISCSCLHPDSWNTRNQDVESKISYRHERTAKLKIDIWRSSSRVNEDSDKLWNTRLSRVEDFNIGRLFSEIIVSKIFISSHEVRVYHGFRILLAKDCL